MNMIVCEVEQPQAYFVVLVYLVVAGGSLVIGIRGRLIPAAALYREVRGGSWRKSCDVGYVPSSSSSG